MPRRKGAAHPRVPARTKLNLTLDAETARRLKVQAAAEGKPVSRFVLDCVAPHLRRWRLDAPDDPAPPGPAGPPC